MCQSLPLPGSKSSSENPGLDQLKKEAAELHARMCASVTGQQRPALRDAQLVLARAYGFASWKELKVHAEGSSVAALADAAGDGDVRRIHAMLKTRPELVTMDMAGGNEHRALHYAVLNRKPDAVLALLAAGADPRKGIYPHRDATSAYTIAKDRNYTEIVALIEEEERLRREERSCPNATVSPVQHELNDAILGGDNARAVEIMSRDGTLVKACDRDGATALHVAAAALNLEMVQYLLAHGANVRKADLRDLSPLDRAVNAVQWRSKGSLEKFAPVASALRDHGAEISPRAAVALGEDSLLRAMYQPIAGPLRGGDLLSVAVNHQRADMVRLLLELRFDPDERHRLKELEEETWSWGQPLWHAAGAGMHEIAEILLRGGADANGAVYASGTPVSQAYGARDRRMLDLLAQFGGKPDAITVGLFRDTDAARELLRHPQTPVAPHLNQETLAEQLLWAGACGGDDEIVRMSLEHVNWPRDDGRWFEILGQPLRIWNHGPGHWVVDEGRAMDRGGYLRCFKLVLDRCDANVRGRFGMRMLHGVAAHGSTWGKAVMYENERVEFARALLEAGADMTVRDDLLKSTPLGWAARWGRGELVNLLLHSGARVDEPDAEDWATPLAWGSKGGNAEIAAMLRAAGATK